MNEPFLISVIYQDTTYEFNARFERWGYTHRIAVLIDDTTYVFEPDEEGGYRALIDPVNADPVRNANLDLLGLVAEKLAKLSTS